MITYTREHLVALYGEPFMEFRVQGQFTELERKSSAMPDRIAIYRIQHPSQFMIFASFEKNEWMPNLGERWAVRELISRMIE
jgi:hypothetical protein